MKFKPQNFRHRLSNPSTLQCTYFTSFPTAEKFVQLHFLRELEVLTATTPFESLQSFQNSGPTTSFLYERTGRSYRGPNQSKQEDRGWQSSSFSPKIPVYLPKISMKRRILHFVSFTFFILAFPYSNMYFPDLFNVAVFEVLFWLFDFFLVLKLKLFVP